MTQEHEISFVLFLLHVGIVLSALTNSPDVQSNHPFQASRSRGLLSQHFTCPLH